MQSRWVRTGRLGVLSGWLGVLSGWLGAALAGVLAAILLAAPASAHAADAPSVTDYRCVVTGISPALPGLTVRTINAGTQLELVNDTGRGIEVLGYAGEPYLRIEPDGVYQNRNSPATYLNETATGGSRPPSWASVAASPVWQKLSSVPAVQWHDHRAHWMSTNRPPVVVADPSTGHRIANWSVPLRDGVLRLTVTGTLDWVPPPQPVVWWVGTALLAVAVAALGRWSSPRMLVVAGLVAGATGLGVLGFAIGSALDAGPLGLPGVLRALVWNELWPLLCGSGALAAGWYATARRAGADLGLGAAGLCTALFVGLSNAAIFAHAVPPTVLPGGVARVVVLLCLGAGAGLAAMTGLRLRRTGPPREPAGAQAQPELEPRLTEQHAG